MNKHRFIDVVKRYYLGCNQRDFDIMMSTFSPDIVHYFVDHEPVIELRGWQIIGVKWDRSPVQLGL